uniref:Uncharacterized protein n=1 Tax=Chenopodium quinoa TaxID=63459 RepID=A0A803M0X3_CHEQI
MRRRRKLTLTWKEESYLRRDFWYQLRGVGNQSDQSADYQYSSQHSCEGSATDIAAEEARGGGDVVQPPPPPSEPIKEEDSESEDTEELFDPSVSPSLSDFPIEEAEMREVTSPSRDVLVEVVNLQTSPPTPPRDPGMF